MTPFFSRAVRIEWGHCDPAGIVFAPRYFEMLTENTVRLFEAAGLGLKRDMLSSRSIVGYPLLECRAKFLRPCRYGDDVVIETAAPKFGNSSFTVQSQITFEGTVCVEYQETRVWAMRDGELGIKSVPVPGEVRAAFARRG